MFDRAAASLGLALLLVVIHVYFLLNVSIRPQASAAALALGLTALACLWLRALAAVIRGWNDSSARILRFTSIGALWLTFWPVGMLVLLTSVPFGSD